MGFGLAPLLVIKRFLADAAGVGVGCPWYRVNCELFRFRWRNPAAAEQAAVASLLLVVMPFATSSFLFLVVRHLLLEAMHLFCCSFRLHVCS